MNEAFSVMIALSLSSLLCSLLATVPLGQDPDILSLNTKW